MTRHAAASSPVSDCRRFLYMGFVPFLLDNRRAVFVYIHDIAMVALSFLISLYLRLGGDVVDYKPRLMAVYIVSLAMIAAVVYRLTGLYRGIWRYASLPDLYNIVRAVSLTILIFLPVMFILPPRVRPSNGTYR